jgi:hypothetical protein
VDLANFCDGNRTVAAPSVPQIGTKSGCRKVFWKDEPGGSAGGAASQDCAGLALLELGFVVVVMFMVQQPRRVEGGRPSP